MLSFYDTGTQSRMDFEPDWGLARCKTTPKIFIESFDYS